MKFSLQSIFVVGSGNVIYAVIKFLLYHRIDNSLYLGLMMTAITISGLKVLEMWNRGQINKK